MTTDNYRLTGFLAKKFPLLSLGVGLVSLGLAWVLGGAHRTEFLLSYLSAFAFFLSLSLGGLFIVLIHFITKAGWSVTVRRTAENFMANLPLLALLFLPILLGLHELYHWTGEEAAHDTLIKGKQGYLNAPFFIARAAGFFLVWSLLSFFFFRGSTAQDKSGDPAITRRLQKLSTAGIMLFGVTLTFAAVDWMMSLDPHWYSTIFGVYYFGGTAMAGFAALSLTLLTLRRAGFLREAVTVEHYHDLGKFMYAFVCFWTYIGFSQFMLIWYANIPEETIFFLKRIEGPWKWVTIVLPVGHFLIPFLLFMSRHAKRNLAFNGLMAAWLLLMHWIDLIWLIKPTHPHQSIPLGPVDLLLMLGIGGLYFALFFFRLGRHALIPVKDPRLAESLHFENA